MELMVQRMINAVVHVRQDVMVLVVRQIINAMVHVLRVVMELLERLVPTALEFVGLVCTLPVDLAHALFVNLDLLTTEQVRATVIQDVLLVPTLFPVL